MPEPKFRSFSVESRLQTLTFLHFQPGKQANSIPPCIALYEVEEQLVSKKIAERLPVLLRPRGFQRLDEAEAWQAQQAEEPIRNMADARRRTVYEDPRTGFGSARDSASPDRK